MDFGVKRKSEGKKAIINSNGQCACWLIGVVSTAFDSTYDPDSILYACRQPGAKCVRVMRMIFIFYCCSTVGVDKQMYKHPLRKINPTRSSSGSVQKEILWKIISYLIGRGIRHVIDIHMLSHSIRCKQHLPLDSGLDQTKIWCV